MGERRRKFEKTKSYDRIDSADRLWRTMLVRRKVLQVVFKRRCEMEVDSSEVVWDD